MGGAGCSRASPRSSPWLGLANPNPNPDPNPDRDPNPNPSPALIPTPNPNPGQEINWHVEPGPQADAGDPASGPNKTYGSLRDGPNIVSGDAAGAHKTWLQFFRNFQPGDHYTVRARAFLTLTLDPNPNPTLC